MQVSNIMNVSFIYFFLYKCKLIKIVRKAVQLFRLCIDQSKGWWKGSHRVLNS